MSSLTDRLRSIEFLHRSIESHGKLPVEVLRKIEYKFRLECNYNSNKIEGGTLTKSETRSVMTGNITVEGKPLKDIREMQGHDEAMKDIFQIGKGEKRLSERRILHMHEMVIKAETPEQEQEIGKWKTVDNYIYNYRLERLDFTPHTEVKESIHRLLDWLNAGLDKIHNNTKDAPNPLLLACEFHLKYLTIHPFVDGNGRTARLLTNLILASLGYPPFWITEGGEKEVYNRYLGDIQTYGGSPDLLYEFLIGLVERSMQIVMDAIEGKDIEDIDDWVKELRLLKSSLPTEDELKVARTKETTEMVLERSIKPTVVELMSKLREYDDLFLTKKMSFSVGSGAIEITNVDDWNNIRPNFNYQVNERVGFTYSLEGYKKDRENPFYIQCRVFWEFGLYDYSCFIEQKNTEKQHVKRYDEFYSSGVRSDIVRQCGQLLLRELESHLNK